MKYRFVHDLMIAGWMITFIALYDSGRMLICFACVPLSFLSSVGFKKISSWGVK